MWRGSNRAHAVAARDEVLGLIQAHYSGPVAEGPDQRFGPTLVGEHLWTDHGVLVARSTLPDWMLEVGLWSRTRRGNHIPETFSSRASTTSHAISTTARPETHAYGEMVPPRRTKDTIPHKN